MPSIYTVMVVELPNLTTCVEVCAYRTYGHLSPAFSYFTYIHHTSFYISSFFFFYIADLLRASISFIIHLPVFHTQKYHLRIGAGVSADWSSRLETKFHPCFLHWRLFIDNHLFECHSHSNTHHYRDTEHRKMSKENRERKRGKPRNRLLTREQSIQWLQAGRLVG